MKGTISKTGDVLTLTPARYDEAVIAAIKELPERRFLKKSKTWRVALNVSSAQLILDFAEQQQFEMSAAVRKEIALFIEQSKGLKALSRTSEIDAEIGDTRLARALMPFQRAGVLYAAHAGRCMIADEMGLGKTLQALAVLEKRNAWPAVVVCPASLKQNWAREAKKWLDGKVIRVLNGTSNHILDGADLIIVNYEIVRVGKEIEVKSKRLGIPKFEWRYDLVELLLSYGMKGVVLDESHVIKNKKAKQTIACEQLCKKIETILLLTGTPVLNRPSELVSQLRALGVFNQLFGTWTKFAERYCGAYQGAWGWDTSGATNLDELNEKLRSCCFVRRTKAEVLKELPAKTVSTVYCTLPASFAKAYQRAEQDLKDYIQSMTDDSGVTNVLARIERLKQDIVAAKLSFVIDWVEMFLESGEKLVLFGWHKKEIMQLHSHFKSRSAVITGDTSLDDRQKAVDLFQEPGSPCRLIIGNIKAAGVGLTLTAASNVAFYEYPWEPGAKLQAEDRVHRYGQKDAVTVYDLIAAGTIDEHIIDLINHKRAVVEETTDGIKRPFAKKQASILSGLVKRLMS